MVTDSESRFAKSLVHHVRNLVMDWYRRMETLDWGQGPFEMRKNKELKRVIVIGSDSIEPLVT